MPKCGARPPKNRPCTPGVPAPYPTRVNGRHASRRNPSKREMPRRTSNCGRTPPKDGSCQKQAAGRTAGKRCQPSSPKSPNRDGGRTPRAGKTSAQPTRISRCKIFTQSAAQRLVSPAAVISKTPQLTNHEIYANRACIPAPKAVRCKRCVRPVRSKLYRKVRRMSGKVLNLDN